MKNKLRNSNSGFTMIELLIYMGLLAIFLLVLIEIFVSMVNVHLQSKADASVDEDGKFIIARLLYDIARANDVLTPAALGGAANTLALQIGSTTYTYVPNGGNLTLTDDIGTENVNSDGTTIVSASFTRLGNLGGKDTVQITVTLESKAHKTGASSGVVKTFQTTGGRR